MSDVLIQIPDEQTLLEKLKEIDLDPHFCEHLYPIFARKAGNSFYPIGIISIIIIGIDEYIKLPNPVIQNLNALRLILSTKIPNFIRAMVPDDHEYDKTIALYWEIYADKPRLD